MRTKFIMPVIMAIALAALAVTPVLAAPGKDKFKVIPPGELVVRYPQKALVGKSFNIGIYVADSLVGNSGGDYDLAALYISVSGPGTCSMWNDWFEAQGLTIDENSDLIVAPYEVLVDPDGTPGNGDEYTVLYYSMEYDEAVSKLGDVAGWTGNVVCLVDAAGDYTFTLKDADGNTLGTFMITVK